LASAKFKLLKHYTAPSHNFNMNHLHSPSCYWSTENADQENSENAKRLTVVNAFVNASTHYVRNTEVYLIIVVECIKYK